MLRQLTIQNYAIIDALEIQFSRGMNIVTGETGAGKSIIIGALGLILGDRADTSVLTDKEKKCIVEGLFGADNRRPVKEFLKKNELEPEDEIVIRREISPGGKSRAFINDTPVTLELLRTFSSLMVDLHQQFDTLQLGENDFQREVIDALAGHTDLLNVYRELFMQWKNIQKKYVELKLQKLQFDKEADYNRFQFNELQEAGFKENELEETDAAIRMLSNAEGIKTTLSKIFHELKESETPVVQQLKQLTAQLQPYASFHTGLPILIQRIQQAQIELQDVADEIDNIGSGIHYDPQKIEELDARLSIGYRLLKKHGVKTTEELLLVQKQLEEKLQAVLSIDESILALESESENLFKEIKKKAEEISAGRAKQIRPFEEKVNKSLVQVGMPNAKLKVDIRNIEEMNEYGGNSIEFLFDANKSGKFLPVSKVASGGELSRLMLCIKSLVARRMDMPTLIFDEIDTGISGEAARQVGIIMKELAEKRQVICITHQPQIAGKADAHFFVYKEIVQDKIKTGIRKLSVDERITAIAKMLSGEKPTAAAMENAKEMVGN